MLSRIPDPPSGEIPKKFSMKFICDLLALIFKATLPAERFRVNHDCGSYQHAN
jgi:hypothetical protein